MSSPLDLLGDAFRSLETQMHFRVARQSVLAGNLANADTPGYRRTELHFQDSLQAAAGRLQTSSAGHIQPNEPGYRAETGPRGTRPDGNGVDFDQEMVQVNRNAGAFMDQAAILGRLIAMRRVAITGQ